MFAYVKQMSKDSRCVDPLTCTPGRVDMPILYSSQLHNIPERIIQITGQHTQTHTHLTDNNAIDNHCPRDHVVQATS